MVDKHHRQSQIIDITSLRSDPNSFLSLRYDDPILQKLETYRLHRAGIPATTIARTFGFARSYLYEMWHQFEVQGTIALVTKNWGTAARKLTTEQEAALIRAKAINPMRSDSDLAEQFGLERTTVYRLLKEHGLQDLHRIVDSTRRGAKTNDRPPKRKSIRKRKQI